MAGAEFWVLLWCGKRSNLGIDSRVGSARVYRVRKPNLSARPATVERTNAPLVQGPAL